ncbi:hypothetical protein Prudu_1051S000200 [Prunus dulcis]|uniref:Uncharacterized protein n=1 Tax=Prunus dulcis TaxID=3755 RepID=A0A5H2XNK3_PRUDU|nr:hypothetical protein Prudu_1051S000200 [Prunus dulcis]
MKSDRCLRTSSLIIVQSVHLTLPHEFRGRSDRECQDLRLGRLGGARDLPRIADQADYGPLHPARATRADLVSPRNLPAGQADHSPLISPVCGSGGLRRRPRPARELTDNRESHFLSTHSLKLVFRPQVVEVHRIHHRATLTSTLQSQVKFWDWSKYRGDSVEFSAEVEEKFEKNLRQKG